jgi:hypothetical protein
MYIVYVPIALLDTILVWAQETTTCCFLSATQYLLFKLLQERNKIGEGAEDSLHLA